MKSKLPMNWRDSVSAAVWDMFQVAFASHFSFTHLHFPCSSLIFVKYMESLQLNVYPLKSRLYALWQLFWYSYDFNGSLSQLFMISPVLPMYVGLMWMYVLTYILIINIVLFCYIMLFLMQMHFNTLLKHCNVVLNS